MGNFKIKISFFALILIIFACEKESSLDSPLINIDIVIDNNIVPAKVAFNNHSLFADSYEWNFGDESISTESSPVHTFSAAGIYKVLLIARNAQYEEIAEFQVTIKEPYCYKIKNNSSYALYNINSYTEDEEVEKSQLSCSNFLDAAQESQVFTSSQSEIHLSFENATGVTFKVAFPFELKEDTLNSLVISNYSLLVL